MPLAAAAETRRRRLRGHVYRQFEDITVFALPVLHDIRRRLQVSTISMSFDHIRNDASSSSLGRVQVEAW